MCFTPAHSSLHYKRSLKALRSIRGVPLSKKILQLLIRNKIENNRTVSDYRRYSFILNRKQYVRIKITGITGVTVVTVLIKNDIGMVTVGCLTSTYPSFHVETPSRSRSVDW